MKKILLLIALSACEKQPCYVDHITKEGIQLCNSYLVNTSDVELTLHQTEKLLNISKLQQIFSEQNVAIRFQTTQQDIPEWAGGMTDVDVKMAIVVITNPCLAKSSLAHELLHLTDLIIFDRVDIDHTNQTWFGDNELSAVGALNKKIKDTSTGCKCTYTDAKGIIHQCEFK